MTEEKKMLPSIAVEQNRGLILTGIEDVQRVAKLFLASGMFSEKNGEQDMAKACVKIIAGQEMGLLPFQAMRGLDMIQGTPAFKYQLVGAKIKSSRRYDFKPILANETKAQVQFYDRGQPVYLSEYTMDMAKKEGLGGKDAYNKRPADMLYARALTKGANKVCPEIFFGQCYSPEDFGAQSGDVFVTDLGGDLPDSADTIEATIVEAQEPVKSQEVATSIPKSSKSAGATAANGQAKTATASATKQQESSKNAAPAESKPKETASQKSETPETVQKTPTEDSPKSSEPTPTADSDQPETVDAVIVDGDDDMF